MHPLIIEIKYLSRYKTSYNVKSGVTFSKLICAKEGEKCPVSTMAFLELATTTTRCIHPVPKHTHSSILLVVKNLSSKPSDIMLHFGWSQRMPTGINKNKDNCNIYSNIFHAPCMSLKLIYDLLHLTIAHKVSRVWGPGTNYWYSIWWHASSTHPPS